MGREGLNGAFPFNLLYHCVYYLNWKPWIYIWQIDFKCKRGIAAKWGKTELWYKDTALPLNVFYLCMHFEFQSALMELCQGQETWISEKFQKVSKAEQRCWYTALSLNIIYHFMKFQQNPLNSFWVMPTTKSFFFYYKWYMIKIKWGRVMVLVYCISSQHTLSLKEVSTKSLLQF